MSDRFYRGASVKKARGRFISYLKEIERDLAKAEKRVLVKAAQHVKKKMREKAKLLFTRRSGNLIAGIDYGMSNHGVIVGPGRPARHAHLLELGTKDRTVKKTGKKVGHVKPKPFILPTFEEEAEAVAEILRGEWLD